LVVIVSFGLIFVVTAALATGMSATVQGIAAPIKAHRQLTVMMIVSNYVVLPALMIGLAALLPFQPQVKLAIAALAMNAGAPFIPWLVSLAKGNLGFSVAIVPVLTVLTIIVMPLALPWAVHTLDSSATITSWIVLWPMLLFILLPMVVGMLVRARWPQLAAQAMVYLGPLSLTFLLVHIILFLGYSWADVKTIPAGSWAFALVFPLAGMLVGYLLSPPYVLSPLPAADKHRGGKIVSSVGVAQQNTGAAITVAIFAFSPFMLAGDYILVAALTTIIVVMLAMVELGTRLAKRTGQASADAVTPPATSAPAPSTPAPAPSTPAAPAPATAAASAAPAQHAQGER
jgi:BASS family bile acid:Na+ symporter